ACVITSFAPEESETDLTTELAVRRRESYHLLAGDNRGRVTLNNLQDLALHAVGAKQLVGDLGQIWLALQSLSEERNVFVHVGQGDVSFARVPQHIRPVDPERGEAVDALVVLPVTSNPLAPVSVCRIDQNHALNLASIRRACQVRTECHCLRGVNQ